MNTAKEIIKVLGLQPHPEGGYFKETYRSEGLIENECLPSYFNGARNYSTCIYFLLTSDSFSAFHRIKQDEIWHFYQGSPIVLYLISDKGNYSEVSIGNELSKGQIPQYVVPGGYWFAAKVANQNSYSLVGCTVSPGFDFTDFELPTRKQLCDLFPEHKSIIAEMTRL
jgi:uncharacterized protein